MNKVTLTLNSLIQYGNEQDDEKTILRLLYLDNLNDLAYFIDINTDKGFPELRRPSEVIEDISLEIASVVSHDPWARMFIEDELTGKEKLIRDTAWKIIEDLIKAENEPYIYLKQFRGKLVIETAQKHKTTPPTVYKYFRKYLQRGKTKNSLLPDYENSGRSENERIITVKKLGRKRKFNHVVEIGEGINVNEDIKKIFRSAISQFYYNPKETSLQTAYNLMLKNWFVEDYEYENGIKKPILVSQDQKPTYAQFHYFYNKEKDIRKKITSRKGRSAYELTHRAILGSSTVEVFGPGSRYEIDATVADVYLVSRFNRNNIIGRPIIYVVIDVFSRMIAGLYVGLEGPSWLGATMALANTVTDKMSFCAEYGIYPTKEYGHCKVRQ